MSSLAERAAALGRDSIQERLIADEYDRHGDDPDQVEFHRTCAEVFEEEANKLLVVEEQPKIDAGLDVLNTLEKNPSMINVESSAKRTDLLLDAGVLPTALDAAESIEAKNSLERMLAHQMALCHDAAFKAISQARGKEDTVEQVRLLNAGARFMETFQKGMLTLHKVRTGGKQTVIVQHVHVTEGGQAVVAGSVGGRETPDGG